MTNALSDRNTAIKSRDNYKKLLDDVSDDFEKTQKERDTLKQKNNSLVIKSKRRALTVVLLTLAFAFTLAFSGWSYFRARGYKTFALNVKAAVADSHMATDLVPDSIRYEYEDLFKTKW